MFFKKSKKDKVKKSFSEKIKHFYRDDDLTEKEILNKTEHYVALGLVLLLTYIISVFYKVPEINKMPDRGEVIGKQFEKSKIIPNNNKTPVITKSSEKYLNYYKR